MKPATIKLVQDLTDEELYHLKNRIGAYIDYDNAEVGESTTLTGNVEGGLEYLRKIGAIESN